jgi:anaerobic ribonucleoside-triphosphate reductase
LREAVDAFYEKDAKDEEKRRFGEELAENVIASVRRLGGRRRRHLVSAVLPDVEASERLARLDVERYGVGRVRFSGTREKPFYSTVDRLALPESGAVNVPVGFSGKARELRSGGSLTVVELGEAEHKPEELLSFTREVFEKGCAELLTYNRRLTYCINCKKSWFGLLHKCPACGSTGTLTMFDRFAAV